MQFRLLGPLSLEAGGPDLASARPRERTVLALLLLSRGRVVSIEALIDALWGDAPPPTARTALHGHVSALRKRLGPERIETQPPGYRLRLVAGDTFDVERFEAILADAGAERPAVRSEMLREALELFRGEVLEDLDAGLDPASELAQELATERARLEELRLVAEERWAAADLELGRHLAVVPRLETIVSLHPLREGLRAQLMLALYRTGRQADALRLAQDGRQLLAAELGVEPGPVLQRLELQILNHDPSLLMAPGAAAGTNLPTGVVTFLATDETDGVEEIAGRHGGVPVPGARQGTVIAFGRAREGAASAAAMQRTPRRDGRSPRIGLHSAAVDLALGAYPLAEMERARRLAGVAHPGQVVLSRACRELLREAPLEEADVRDIGVHRLADLGPAQPLFQLVASGLAVVFPPLRGLDARPTNLPVQPTELIGRERELEAVTDLLRESDTRLVTLTGPGGTGKTRLAVHAAAALLDDFPDGVFFVPLEAVAEPELVGSAIAMAAGIRQSGGESPATLLLRALHERRILLVLDNFEHLLAAAPIVGEILAAAPDVRVLATSRRRLGLEDERVFAVPTLAAPVLPATSGAPTNLAELQGIEAVALFGARARAVSPEFLLTSENAGAVASLCRALDGLPLAIELVASRVAILPPTVLLDRLNQGMRLSAGTRRPGPERHRALQVTIDWSHDLLEPAAQRLLRVAAVFAGGWTLDAAESVCGDELDVINGLADLVDQSLVGLHGTEAAPRFGMLETIHEYARDKLRASGLQAEVERRHAAYFLSLAQAAESHLRGNPGSWLPRVQMEHDNIRAALDRLAALGAAEAEASLAGHLWRFWYLAGHLSEGRRRLEHALEVHAQPTAARARALLGAAVMALNTDDLTIARQRATEGLALHRSMADAWGAAYCLYIIGAVGRGEGDHEMARTVQEEALSAFRALGDEHSALLVSRNLAGTLSDLGDRDGATRLYQDNLRRARLDRNGRLEASSLGALATLAFEDGRVADALWMLRESLRLHRELADRLDTALDLARAARMLSMVGRPVEAARVVAALSAVRDELGARRWGVAAMTDDTLASVRRQLPAPEVAGALQVGSALRLEDALELALDALA